MDLKWQINLRGTQEKNVILRIGFAFLCAVCIIQATVIVNLAARPVKAMVVSGRVTPGVYTAGEYTEDFIKSFADYFLEKYNNVSPATVDTAYDISSPEGLLVNYMAPEFLAQTKAVLEKDKETVKQDSLTFIFKSAGMPALEKSKDGYYLVTLTGHKQVWMGSIVTQEKDLEFTLWIREATPNKHNPFGLVVAGMQRKVIKSYK